ncbi:MAG: sigma-54 dependent transcriptional regulator [Acidobacteriota bacterium]
MERIRTARLLVVDDDVDVLYAARLFLKQHVAQVDCEKDPNRIPELLREAAYDVILLDMNFGKDVTSGQEGFQWLQRILDMDPAAVVILITAYGDVDMAVRAVKQGATDFVLKPWQNEKLLATVSSALSLRRSRLEVDRLRSQQERLSADLDSSFQECIGSSPPMQRVFATIQKVAATDANVLILGENGTGKELVARALHRGSLRANQVFLSVDMGAIVESLFESELFGHVKGAFTDARTDRPGRFELASGGTLFLDEIGNLSLPMQARILRALEMRQVTRVGSNRATEVDIRLICASNRPIAEMVARKEFRQDLLYRINTVEIALPPLRDRGDDILLLADYYLKLFCRHYGKNPVQFSLAALKKLQKHAWPGNVRELKHAVERAVILSESPQLEPEDFLFSGAQSDRDELALESYNIEDVEKALIRKAMVKHGGNISHVAKELGLTRASLYRRIEKYALH